MDPFLEGFRDYMLFELERRQSTVDAYVLRIGYLQAARDGKPIAMFTPDDLRALKRQRPVASQTLKGWFVALRQFVEWMQLEHPEIEIDPRLLMVPPPRVDDEDSPPPLATHKVRALLEACRRPLEFRLVHYGSHAGCRIGESARIPGEAWQDGWLRFPGEKNGRMREIPIHKEMERVKFQIFASLPTDKSTLQRVKRRLEERVGFPFVSHQLRKSFSYTMYDNDIPEEVVEDLLGHAPSRTIRRHGYSGVSRRRKLEAMATVDYYIDDPLGLTAA